MYFDNNHNMTTVTHSAINVQNASTLVSAINPDRQYMYLQNDSDTVIYLGLDVAAEANKGIRLAANGGTYEMSPAQANLSKCAVYAISASSGKNLLVTKG